MPIGYDTPDMVPDNEYTDFITSGSNNDAERVIASYEVKPEDNGVFSLSAYLLPIAAGMEIGQSTLELVMTDSNGNELRGAGYFISLIININTQWYRHY